MKPVTGDWLAAPATAERPIFAIGDVHGAARKLVAMLEAIEEIVAGERLADPQIVFLGDYIDRGPQSMQALKCALDGIYPDDVALPGNHEQFLREVLDGNASEVLWIWFRNGGDKVAAELGFSTAEAMADPARLVDAIRSNLGEARLERFFAMPNHLRHGRFLFVHAGIHPAIPLDEMLDQPWSSFGGDEDFDPLWIRGPFLTHDGAFPDDVVVVHGHTIMNEPQLGRHRISLDTGAYGGRPLTGLQLQGDRMRLLQVQD